MRFLKVLNYLPELMFLFFYAECYEVNSGIRSTNSREVFLLKNQYNQLKNNYENLLKAKGGGRQEVFDELKGQLFRKDVLIKKLKQKNLGLSKNNEILINDNNRLNHEIGQLEGVQGELDCLLKNIQSLEIFKDFDIEDILRENINDKIKEIENFYKKDIAMLKKSEEEGFDFSDCDFRNHNLKSFAIELKRKISAIQNSTDSTETGNNKNVPFNTQNRELNDLKKELKEFRDVIKNSKIFDGYKGINYNGNNVNEELKKAFLCKEKNQSLSYVSLQDLLKKIEEKVKNKNIDTSLQNVGNVVSPILDKVYNYVDFLEKQNKDLETKKNSLENQVKELKNSQTLEKNLPYYAVFDMCVLMNILYNKGQKYLNLLEKVIKILNEGCSTSLEEKLRELFKSLEDKTIHKNIQSAQLNHFSEKKINLYKYNAKGKPVEICPTYIEQFSQKFYNYLQNGFKSFPGNIYSPLTKMNGKGKQDNYVRSNKKDTNFSINTKGKI